MKTLINVAYGLVLGFGGGYTVCHFNEAGSRPSEATISATMEHIPDADMVNAVETVKVEEGVGRMEGKIDKLDGNVGVFTARLAKMAAQLERIEVCRVHLKTVTQ